MNPKDEVTLSQAIMEEVTRYNDGMGCTRRQLVDNILIAINQSSRASVAAPQGDTLEQIAIKIEFLQNASYGELRSSVETNREYIPAPNEPCIGQGDPSYRHFKNYATKEEWAVAERVSGWFQTRLDEVAKLVENLRNPSPAAPSLIGLLEGRTRAYREAEVERKARWAAAPPTATAELDALQSAYNQGIEDAKCAIRAESQGGGYWAATFINAIARRCSPFRYTGMPREADEPTREQVLQAITDLQEARESHALWAAHLRQPHTFECQGCEDHAAHIGDAEYHDEWIAKYDNVIYVLAHTPFGAAATSGARETANAAATEICDWCGVDSNDAERVAEIILKHFPSAAPVEEQVYCYTCSVAANAAHPIYHQPPVCTVVATNTDDETFLYQQVKEVLESFKKRNLNGPCWCAAFHPTTPHEPQCQAARALYAKLGILPVSDAGASKVIPSRPPPRKAITFTP